MLKATSSIRGCPRLLSRLAGRQGWGIVLVRLASLAHHGGVILYTGIGHGLMAGVLTLIHQAMPPLAFSIAGIAFLGESLRPSFTQSRWWKKIFGFDEVPLIGHGFTLSDLRTFKITEDDDELRTTLQELIIYLKDIIDFLDTTLTFPYTYYREAFSDRNRSQF